MATVSINANVGKKLSESTFVSQLVGGSGDIVADATTADTDVGTVVSDLTAAFTAFNTFGAALVVITGDTYSSSTHQFTTGGATGLTHAQWVTLAAELNTAMTDFVTAQTDAATAKTATAAAKSALGADVTVIVNSATVTSANAFRSVWRKIQGALGGLGFNFSM